MIIAWIIGIVSMVVVDWLYRPRPGTDGWVNVEEIPADLSLPFWATNLYWVLLALVAFLFGVRWLYLGIKCWHDHPGGWE